MSLGETIRITRQKSFYTQEEFARKLNVALSTVNRWELNKAKPSVKAMNCTPFVRQYGILFRKWGVFVCQRDNESTTELKR